MKTRFVRLALIVITAGIAWACGEPAGPGMIEPDMYVRIVDARVMRDAIQLDMTQTIMECEADETRPCGSDEGLCQIGTEACTENGLWSGQCLGSVEPGEELCDEQDNDCDGLVDEVYRLGQTCKYTDDRGFERTGRVYCNIDEGIPYCRPETDCSVDEDGDGSGVCDDCDDMDPQNFPGNAERCDTTDNDCDGRADETFDLDMACQVGEGLCRRGGMTICAMNGTEVVCDGEAGEPADETCDGLDNDCDGNTDEGFQLMAECTVGIGACTRPGIIACNAMGDAACMGDPGMPGIETCNEADDDCDMTIDEGLGLGDECTVGRGLCERQGINRCNPNGDGTVSCSVEPGAPAGDELCDGLDNDCDGVVDEGNPGGGDICDTQRPGRCGEGIETCVGGAIICQPNAAGIPEVCNDVDDDCNEIVDDVDGRGEPCSAGVGECARNGTQECTVGVGLVCTAQAADPSAELCNGLDDDCDGTIDEGNPGGGIACETDRPGRCLLGNTVCVEGDIECQGVNEPIAETCNNVDDDCNNLIDDVAGRGDACSAGVGACRRDGTRQCIGNELACSALAGNASPERCDAIDNDCDGLSDEDFALQQPCTVGQGACEAPGVTACAPDGLDVICEGEEGLVAVEICNGLDDDCDGRADENNPESGGECQTGQDGRCSSGLRNCRMGRLVCDRIDEPQAETCNAIDDDCDGELDEDYNVGDACVRGVGVCRASGNMICNAAEDGTECNAEAGIPQFELCNGDDDDCDGSTDEDFNLGALCEAGVGRCQSRGAIVCREDGSAGCNAEPLEALPDELCNLIDDDCDGEMDEGNPEGGAACPVNNPGVCSIGIMNCSEGELSCVADAVPGERDEICDGQDNDCDNQIDEDNPGGGVVCQTQDLGACRDGHTQCAGGFLLCFADVAPAPETCDFVDNDCDGSVDEAFPTLGDACDSEEDEDLCATGTLACNPETGGLFCFDDLNVEEVCDNRDNDCDGIIDNGFDKLSDVTNCGTCGRDCRDPDPQVEGQEYPNAACVAGACFQTFYVDETNGSNTNGDGSQASPWRSLRFANRLFVDGGIDASSYAARIYVLPGRYASDQWVNATQCDGNNDGDPTNDLCVNHTVACETDNNPNTTERCTECVCEPSLVCNAGTCSLPEAEREDFPIKMRDKIQVVGLGDSDHIIVDGGSRTCFIQENGNPACNIDARNDSGTLVEAVDMADREFQDEANTCFEPDNPRCMDPNNPNYAFLSAQPNWDARGSRNLLANLTLLRGGQGNDSTLELGANDRYVESQGRTSLRVQGVTFLKIKSTPGYPAGRFDDSDVFMDQVLVRSSVGLGARGLFLATNSSVTVDRSHFEDNNITQDGYGLIRASNAELNVRNSTFVDNDGGGVFFHSGGLGSVFYSTFAGNVNYQIVVGQGAQGPAIIANNVFAFNSKTSNAAVRRGASVYVHRDEQGGSSVHNNLFFEPAGNVVFVDGRSPHSNVITLNAESWASDNVGGLNPLLSNVDGNDLSISNVNSTAVDMASPWPVPVPPPSVTPDPLGGRVDCGGDFECIARNARDPKWNLSAYVCEDNLCTVDTLSDTDEDGFPDWIELIFGSSELDIASWPPEYDVTGDFDGFPRPSGLQKDVGAYEFTQEPTCGNGIVELGEECDDENNANGDGCADDCTIE